ncbi:unnamed protein product, partial [Choristocarpus tenellus]
STCSQQVTTRRGKTCNNNDQKFWLSSSKKHQLSRVGIACHTEGPALATDLKGNCLLCSRRK